MRSRYQSAVLRAGIVGTLVLLSVLSANIVAATIVIVPTDLQAGDKYHLVFLTSTSRDAHASNIATYDAFVQAAADAANLGIGSTLGMGDITWKAIASTSTVNAVDHVAVAGPVYRLDDVLVATGSADLFDGTLLAPISRTEEDDGIDYNFSTWTGSIVGGLKHSTFPLGGPFRANLGHSGQVNGTWINANSNILGNQRRLYAISEELTAPGTVSVETRSWSHIKALFQ